MKKFTLLISFLFIFALTHRAFSQTVSSGGNIIIGAPLPAGSNTIGAIGQGLTILNAAPTVSAANTAATVTLTGVAGQRACIRTVAVKATGAAATFTLTFNDGATTVLDLGTLSAGLGVAAIFFQGTPLMCGSMGNTVTINIGAGGAGAITNTTVIADRG